MKLSKRKVIALIVAILVMVGGGYWVFAANQKKPTENTQPIAIDKPVIKVGDYDDYDNLTVAGIIKETNIYRESKGLSPLVENDLLNQSACLKAQDMMDKDYWEHVSPDGIEPWYWFDQVGYRYVNAGENLAYGYARDKNVVYSWINSRLHEANLVGEYTEIGICVKHGIFQGKLTNLAVAHYGSQ